jgi:galactose mutarotase-like enzyme
VTVRYAVQNEGHDRLPFIWSAHPILPLTGDTVLDLPRDTPLRVYAHHKLDLGDPAMEHRWPFVRTGGKVLDFSRPADVARRYACKLFLDLAEGRAAIEQDGARLEVRFDAREVPNFGLWINHRGWTPFRRGKPYLNLAFEPCIGAPDPLSEALGSWKGAHWLEPGETRRWTLTWTGHRPGGEAQDDGR